MSHPNDNPRITEDVNLDDAFQAVRPDYTPPNPYEGTVPDPYSASAVPERRRPLEEPSDEEYEETRRAAAEMAEARRAPTTDAKGTSRIPDHAPRPQDHKAPTPRPAATPVQNEAEGVETVSMEYDGMTFSIPADPLDWPISATEAFENGKLVSAVKFLIGDQAFARLVQKGYRNKDFGPMFDKLAELGGFETAGN